MIKIRLDPQDNIISAMSKLKSVADTEIELEIPEKSPIFDNVLNIKLIKKESGRYGRVISFLTNDIVGNSLIASVEDSEKPSGVTPIQEPLDEINAVKIVHNKTLLPKIAFKLPKFSFDPNFGNKKLFVKIGGVVAAILILFFLTTLPKAYTKIIINAQPLTRSLTIKISKNAATNPANKTLAGITLTAAVSDTLSGPTTGTLITGKKASGSITLYNKTLSTISLKKGAVVTYEKNGTKYNFTLDKAIEIPAEEKLPTDPAFTGDQYKWGEATAAVTAADVGDKYNLKSGTDLSISGQKNSEASAKTKDDLSGGSSKTVAAVAAADLTKLSTDLLKDLTDKAQTALQTKGGSTQKLVTGAVKVTIDQENFNHKVGEEATTVEVTQNVVAEGLFYSTADINKLLDTLVSDLVPQGYVVSSKEKELTVDALGNTTASKTTSEEADVQVTLKTFVVPDLDIEKIKSSLLGKNLSDAQKVLGSIKNIKTYQLNISPSIPLLQSVPNDPKRVFVEIVRE